MSPIRSRDPAKAEFVVYVRRETSRASPCSGLILINDGPHKPYSKRDARWIDPANYFFHWIKEFTE